MPMPLKKSDKDKSSWYYTEEDDKKILELFKDFRPIRQQAFKDKMLTNAPIPEFIGVKVLEIATNIAKNACYRNQPFKEDMIMEAVEYVFLYIHNFDPEHVGVRSGKVNFHSYCTRTIDRRFGRYIAMEEEQRYLKEASFVNMGGHAAFESEVSEHPDLMNNLDNTEMGRDVYTRVSAYEAKVESKREESRRKRRERREAATKDKKQAKAKPTNGLARAIARRKQNND